MNTKATRLRFLGNYWLLNFRKHRVQKLRKFQHFVFGAEILTPLPKRNWSGFVELFGLSPCVPPSRHHSKYLYV